MKKNLYISTIAAIAIGLTSCESDINNFMVDDTVGFLNTGILETEVYSGVNDPVKVVVIKAGKGFNSATLSMVVAPELISTYNEQSTTTTPVSELPSDCYTIMTSSMTLSSEDYRAYFEINWNFDKLEAALSEDPNLVVPLRLKVTTDGRIAEDRTTVMVKPVITVPYVSLEKSGLVAATTMPNRSTLREEEIYFNVNANFIAQRDITYKLEIDQSLLDEYNSAQGTDYVLLPQEAYTLDAGGTIKQHLSSDKFKLTFHREGLIPDNGPSKFGNYILPIRLTSLSESQINESKSSMLYMIKVEASEINKSKWTLYESNADLADDPTVSNTEANKYSPSKLFDGDKQTYWRTPYNSPNKLPYYVVIDLGQDRDLYQFVYDIPSLRADKVYANTKSGYIEVSTDGTSYTKVGEFTALASSVGATVQLTPCTARYVKFVISEVFKDELIVSDVNLYNSTAISEITLYGE